MKNPWKAISDVNPQTERGCRRIASDIFITRILSCLGAVEYQILDTVINFTWGFKKKEAEISYGTFQKLTKRSRQAIINNIKKLVYRRILVKETKLVKHHLPVNTYMINKYYDTWITLTSTPLLTPFDLKLVKSYTRNWSKLASKTSQRGFTHYNKYNKESIKGVQKNKIAPTEINGAGQKLLDGLGIKPPEDNLRKSHKKKPAKITDQDLEF
jgi:hypothetical protein